VSRKKTCDYTFTRNFWPIIIFFENLHDICNKCAKYDVKPVANFMDRTMINEFLKSANMCHRHEQMHSGIKISQNSFRGLLFDSHCRYFVTL